jgi:hypothetical protein
MYQNIKIVPYSLTNKGRVVILKSAGSINDLKERLNRIHFRSVTANDESVGNCEWCEHHRVQLLNPSDPDNSEREFYCSYCSFMFQGVEWALDLTHFTCDCFTEDKLFQEAFKPYSNPRSKKQQKQRSIWKQIFEKE